MWVAAGVAKIEVSLDGGKSWLTARLEPRRQWSWQRFSFDWQSGGPSNFTLAARATDTRGVAQPMEKARNSVHTVAVTVACAARAERLLARSPAAGPTWTSPRGRYEVSALLADLTNQALLVG